MATATQRPCANLACFCETSDVTCSLWCGALDRPADVRCHCRHDNCARPLARAPAWSAGRVQVRPAAGEPLVQGRRRGFPSVGSG